MVRDTTGLSHRELAQTKASISACQPTLSSSVPFRDALLTQNALHEVFQLKAGNL
jgi:hypothetical protein